MTNEELIRNLKYTIEKHKNDKVDTFGTNISLMCKDVLDYLEQSTSDDCVSIAELEKWLDLNFSFGGACRKLELFERLEKELPRVTPTFPKGATNGDMIKAMFPDCKDWKAKLEDNDGEVYEVHFVQLPNSLTVNKYEESWWNAPYTEMRDSENGL